MSSKMPIITLSWPDKEPPQPKETHIKHVSSHPSASSESENRLYMGDNLDTLHALLPTHAQKLDLIYIDPPFATGRIFRTQGSKDTQATAYKDTWPDLAAFLSMLYPRLFLMAQLLRPNGVFVIHTDARFSYYMGPLLLEIFGEDSLQNEIIWSYGGRGAKARSGQFPRNHDTLLVFCKGKPTYHRQYRNVSYPKDRLPRHIRLDEAGVPFKTSPRGDYTDESVAQLEKEGRIYRTRSGQVRIKYFLEHDKNNVIESKLVGDVWDDIPDMMHSAHAERSGYPTQKPLALLERLLSAFSEPQHLVADFFCGSGTTLLAAESLKRRWIGADQSPIALQTTQQRLLQRHPPAHYHLFETSAVLSPSSRTET
ncbi:MAG: site-specific DNA-methyltransferase [Myxococcales bacterium]|nr:site-specific DNA-methyltransferase [Myxococcales bacterium]MCB9644608.1 site-specific DNA-methyltransferase [Myxococcales bacterium]